MLEMRVDNILYRLGLAPSRSASRQIVRHGHVTVNGKKVSIPSYITRPGDADDATRYGVHETIREYSLGSVFNPLLMHQTVLRQECQQPLERPQD